MRQDSVNTINPDLDTRLTRIESLLVPGRPGGEVDLLNLARIVWRGKWLIVTVIAIFAVASVALAFLLPVEYTATALLTPADSSSTSNLSTIAQEFGGLAALGGIQLSQSKDRSAEVIKVMKSWDFLADFIQEHHLDVDVLAATGWDPAQNRLYIDPSLFDVKDHKWVKKFDSVVGETTAPSGWELYKAFRDRLSVEQDKTTGLITIDVEFYSPILAKEWVDGLITAINERFRLQDREQAQESLDYLDRQVQQTNVESMKSVLYDLVGRQMQTLMLTKVNREYVLKIVSGARIPEHPSSPHRLLIILGGAVLGAVLSIILVILRDVSLSTRHSGMER